MELKKKNINLPNQINYPQKVTRLIFFNFNKFNRKIMSEKYETFDLSNLEVFKINK